MLGCLQEKFKSLILIALGLLSWKPIIGSWQESEEPLKVIQLFTREEPLMVLQHVIFLPLHLWRTFKGTSQVKSWRTFKGSLGVKRWRTFYGSSQLSIVCRSLGLVQIARFQIEPLTILKNHWRTFFSESVVKLSILSLPYPTGLHLQLCIINKRNHQA